VSPRRLFAESLQVLAAAIVMIAAAEILLRVIYEVRNAAVDVVLLPYNAAQDFGSMPPWADGQRILEPDDALVWRNRSGVTRRYLDVFSPVDSEEDRRALLQQFLPGVPASLRDNPLWEVSLNSRGFRTDEFSTQKAPGVFRIACVGDSWTFGSNVDQRDAYPQQLGGLLAHAFPEASFEVLNLGTMAYSSHQGLELVRRQVLDLSPDAILVGFGMNDASVAGYRDKDFSGGRGSDSLAKRTRRLLERIELLRLLRYLGRATRHESWSIGDYMGKLAKAAGTPAEAWMGGQGTESADYDELEPYTRVSPGDYERNLREIVRLARAQRADVVLLYNQLWNTPYREVVRRLASEEELAWIDQRPQTGIGAPAGGRWRWCSARTLPNGRCPMRSSWRVHIPRWEEACRTGSGCMTTGRMETSAPATVSGRWRSDSRAAPRSSMSTPTAVEKAVGRGSTSPRCDGSRFPTSEPGRSIDPSTASEPSIFRRTAGTRMQPAIGSSRELPSMR
jgi:hypothetical protein